MSNSKLAAAYLTHQRENQIAAPNLDAAKMALVDWVCVCLGGRETPEALILRRYLEQTPRAPGSAPMLIGGSGAATTAALINGTLSHCLDYDDTHIPTALHGSGPTWAAVFALGVERGANEEDMLKAFLSGFEIGASFGSGGLGVRLNESGYHSTAVLGRISSAMASAYLLKLSPDEIESALGLAATQAGGLTASFGTMAKPFHAGKAAMDGIVAAQFASAGLEGATNLLDSSKGLFGTLFQDRAVVPSLGDMFASSEILLNSLKPYAACQLTHAPIDAALALSGKANADVIESIKIQVNPLAVEIAGVENAKTPTEGRFSTAFCVALAMHGYPVSPDDFVPERLADPALIALAARVSLEGNAEISRTGARLEAKLADGTIVNTVIEHALGSAGNPMDWSMLERKFQSLVEPIYAGQASELFEILSNFERPGALKQFLAFTGKLQPVGGR